MNSPLAKVHVYSYTMNGAPAERKSLHTSMPSKGRARGGRSEEEVAQPSEKKPNVVVMNKISSPALIMEQNGSKWYRRPGL